MAPLLIVLSGPSGVGKDTLIHKLLLTEPKMRKITTVTTRAPRPGEVDGRDHYFVSLDRFLKLIAEGALLEHAKVYDNWYGVPKADVDCYMKRGFDVVLRTDIQGAASVKTLLPKALTIFISPTNVSDLKRRIGKRGAGDARDQALRLKTARKEMQAAESFDHVVVNPENDLDAAVESVRRILGEERGRD